MLTVEHLTMVYPDGTVALKDVSFEVKDGEFLGIIGLSGSGKSTLLRCINRLLEPSDGRIIWNGKDITHLPQGELRTVRREIGMVFQQFNLVKRSSVMTNVLSGRLGYTPPSWALANRFSRKDRELAVQALARVGIPDKANNRADELSGGQQQRVGIARALMQEPKMILADEPVASLDPVLAHSILGYLEKLNSEDGISVLCSLHYLDLVQRYCERVIGLRDGRMVFEGSKKDIAEISDERFREIYGQDAVRMGGL
jgi:phosphonate transport system ATP-binding protein